MKNKFELATMIESPCSVIIGGENAPTGNLSFAGSTMSSQIYHKFHHPKYVWALPFLQHVVTNKLLNFSQSLRSKNNVRSFGFLMANALSWPVSC